MTINHFKIYPNPSNEYIIIENKEGFNFLIEIFDIYGNITETNYINAFENKKINTIQLTDGVYILQLKNNNTFLNYKFFKN